MKSYFTDKIVTLEDAGKLWQGLAADGSLFHPDDDPSDIFNASGKCIFTDAELVEVRARLVEARMVDSDPCATIMAAGL